MQISPAFCILPWQVHIDEAGRILPCCATRHIDFVPKHFPDGPNLHYERLPEAWNGNVFKKVRQKMLIGKKPKSCFACYQQEALGGSSMRLIKNNQFLNHPKWQKDVLHRIEYSKKNNGVVEELPFSYDLRPGKLCNLKCRHCSAKWSSLIENDPVHQQWSPGPPEIKEKGKAGFANWYEDMAIIEDRILVDPTKVKLLFFAGGEPLIMPSVKEALRRLVDNHMASQIKISFSTNLKVVTDKTLKLISSFRFPEIFVSVDGYKSVYEYIRYPIKWERLEINLKRLQQEKNISLGCRPTINIYNIMDVSNLLDYLEEQNIDWAVGFVVAPQFLSARLMSQNGKSAAAERLEKFLERSQLAAKKPVLRSRIEMVIRDMMKPFPDQKHQYLLDKFMAFTNDLDRSRSQDIHETLPEVCHYIEEAAGGWSNKIRFFNTH